MQDHPILREMLESRREAVEARNYWRSVDTPEAHERLAEFEELVTDLDREIGKAIKGLTSIPLGEESV